MNPMRAESDSRNESPHRSAWMAQLGLAVVIMAAFPVIASWGWIRLEWVGVYCAAIAGGICWLAGAIAIGLVAKGSRANKNNVVPAVMLGTLVRLAIPIVALIVAANVVDVQTSRCLSGMIVANYLLGLAVETYLIMQYLKVAPSVAKVS